MSNPNRPDDVHERGEAGRRESSTAAAAPKDPMAHELPGAVPGSIGIDDTGARMVPPGDAACGTTPGGTSAEGASGGAGLPGGTPPRDDDRKPKRLAR